MDGIDFSVYYGKAYLLISKVLASFMATFFLTEYFLSMPVLSNLLVCFWDKKGAFGSMRLGILFCLQMLLVMPTQAQSFSAKPDQQLWLQAGATVKLDKRWSVGLNEELRLANNVHKVNQFYSEPNVKFSVTKAFKIGAFYRFAWRPNVPNVHRVGGDLLYSFFADKAHLEISNRLRIHSDLKKHSAPDNTIRYKAGLRYNPPKCIIKPHLDLEWFFSYANPKNNGFSRDRIYGGADFAINQTNTIVFYYIAEVFPSNSNWNSIFRVGYQASFDAENWHKKPSSL
jgi:hypothetical protein